MTHVIALEDGQSILGHLSLLHRFLHVHLSVYIYMTMHGNVYVHVQKRTGDKYPYNETDKNSGYFQCPATKLFLIMQHYVF